jgi:RNase P/RNase MRP subunit p29
MEKAGKITPEQNAILSLIGLTFKIMAEKATQLEKLEEGFQGNFINEGDFNRN